MKLKSATALLFSSFTLLAASLAVAQQNQPRTVPTGSLPLARPVGLPGTTAAQLPRTPTQPPTGTGRPATTPPAVPTATAAPATPATGPSGRSGTPGQPGAPREFESGIEYTPLPPGARITFNLQDADLPELIRAIGNITGKRFILSGKLRSIKATIYSPTRVTAGEAYQAFLSALEVNGMTVVPAGRYMEVQESAGSATQPLHTYSPGETVPTDQQYITRIHRLRNISADDASTLLGHFRSRDGDITPYAATNTLVITDTGANIRRMMQILVEVDVPGIGEQIWVERVHYAPAQELAQRITDLLGQPGGGGGRPGAANGQSDNRLTRITPDDRSNSLIIVATERMYLRVLELIRRLDVPIEGEGELHVQYLQHADAEELANTLNQIVQGGRPAGAAGQGARTSTTVFEGPLRITADKRTNALVITSSPRDYSSVRHVISELDRARRQVFIEAVVMELSVSNSNRLGISWHGGAQPIPGEDWLALGGFQPALSVGFPTSLATNADVLQGVVLGVRGPIIDGTQGQLGLSTGIPGVGAVISALTSSGDSDVLATPSIIATDNTLATINVGQNVPTQINGGGLPSVPGAAGAVPGLAGLGGFGFGTAPRADVGTKISVTPHINDANEIRLDIDEEISELGEAPGGGGTLGAFAINKRNAKTSVVVQDQQTVVIGGLIRNAIVRNTQRIPILGDLPLIGILFRTERREVQRRNLLLFMTPYVIRDQSDLRRIFERKMRERQEFLDRYFVFSAADEFRPLVDYSRTNGIVEEIRQSIREMRVQTEIEERAVPRPAPPHMVTEPIELPAELRTPSGGGGPGPPSSGVPQSRALPMAVPVNTPPPMASPAPSPKTVNTGPPPREGPEP